MPVRSSNMQKSDERQILCWRSWVRVGPLVFAGRRLARSGVMVGFIMDVKAALYRVFMRWPTGLGVGLARVCYCPEPAVWCRLRTGRIGYALFFHRWAGLFGCSSLYGDRYPAVEGPAGSCWTTIAGGKTTLGPWSRRPRE